MKEGVRKPIESTKKHEKRNREKPSSVSSSLISLNVIDKAKDTEFYVCTGNFLTDFTELCSRVGFSPAPEVKKRPKWPLFPASNGSGVQQQAVSGNPIPVGSNGQIEVGGKASKVAAHRGKLLSAMGTVGRFTEMGGVVVGECDIMASTQIDETPRTFLLTGKYEYFKPSVQIQSDNSDQISEAYIRGWRVDIEMMNILSECWIASSKLHTLDLWNIGLNNATLEMLSCFIHKCQTIRVLNLDSNPVEGEGWFKLIMDNSSVQHLSLRYNMISDCGATCLGLALGNQMLGQEKVIIPVDNNDKSLNRTETRLLSLNLSGNKISDYGTQMLAQGLRFNRTLLVLDLSNNFVGDVGANAFAQLISRFPLTHEETTIRRKLFLSSIFEQLTDNDNLPIAIDTLSTKQSLSGESLRTKNAKGNANVNNISNNAKNPQKRSESKAAESREDDKKKSKDPEKSRKDKNVPESSKNSVGKKSEKNKIKKNENVKDTEVSQKRVSEDSSTKNPLMADILYDNHLCALLLNGNFHLASLNLSNNSISDCGLLALLNAILFQREIMGEKDRTYKTQVERINSFTGLHRLLLKNNLVPPDCETILKIDEVMRKREFNQFINS